MPKGIQAQFVNHFRYHYTLFIMGAILVEAVYAYSASVLKVCL